MKKFLTLFAAMFVAMGFTAFAAEISGNIDTAMTLTENTTIANEVTISETVTVSGDVTLSGGTITRAEGMTAPMFIVEADSKLTLEGITIDGGAVWTYEVSADEPTKAEAVANRGSVNTGVVAGANVIENSGIVVIGKGAVIKNNDGGVAVNAKKGSITTINGGEILDITAGAGSAVIASETNTTALIEMKDGKISGHITGGGVFWHRGPAVVDGGEICYNYSTASAGIFRMATGNSLKVTINGGKIHHNEANSYGGVIYAYGKSIIEINGGEISENKAVDGGVIYGSAAKYSSLVINDGLITKNYASSTAGAIHLADWWTFAMNGGEISYNETPGLGGALRQWASWGTNFNGGVVEGNTASEGEAIWMGNGLFLSGTQFIDNDIYTADYIRVDSDFAPFELSGAQTADVRGNGDYVLTQEDLAKISVNSLGKFPYYDEATKHIIYVDEYVTVLKDGQPVQVKTLEEAVELAEEDDQVVLLSNVSDKNLTINKKVTIVSQSKARTMPVLENVVFTVEKGASLSLDGFAIEGLSYIYAKEPESISVTNCNINANTIEVSGTNCPPAFVLFSSSDNGSVEFTFTGNTLLATPDETEDWYTYNHGIAGWNSIEKAVIKNNTFGSKKNPLGAAAIKLMNFVDGATVEVSGNTFYVESKDSTCGPNAIQFYQNNSRDNNYTVTISKNNFNTDAETAAIGVNVNGTAGGATVEIDTENTVNGKAIAITDIIVFGNSINNDGATRNYVGVGVEKDDNGGVVGGWFHPNSLGLEAALADGYDFVADGEGYIKVVEDDYVDNNITIKVEFVKADKDDAGNDTDEEADLYNINLVADDGKIINRLNSVDLTFALEQAVDAEGNKIGKNDFEIIASNKDIAVNPVNNSKVRYEFHFEGKDNVEDTNEIITIGQVKFSGYGIYSFAVDTAANATNAAHATTVLDNLVDTFIPEGVTIDGKTTGVLDVSDNTIKDVLIAVPTRNLIINIDFPNAVKADNNYKYQAMKVVVSGGDLEEAIVVDLGADAKMPNLVTDVKTEATVSVAITDKYVVTLKDVLEVNNSYNVEVSGEGYRTAKYTVTMNCEESKTLNFWNNVKDNAVNVEEKKDSSAKNVTFLAGDIVKDTIINIYDLSAVVSYFGETGLSASKNPEYAKYDLNRDGKIDSKDVAYVLVSWSK